MDIHNKYAELFQTKRFVKVTPTVRECIEKVGSNKYRTKLGTVIEWMIVDVEGVPHLARLEKDDENKERTARKVARLKAANSTVLTLQEAIELSQDIVDKISVIEDQDNSDTAFIFKSLLNDLVSAAKDTPIQSLLSDIYDRGEHISNDIMFFANKFNSQFVKTSNVEKLLHTVKVASGSISIEDALNKLTQLDPNALIAEGMSVNDLIQFLQGLITNDVETDESTLSKIFPMSFTDNFKLLEASIKQMFKYGEELFSKSELYSLQNAVVETEDEYDAMDYKFSSNEEAAQAIYDYQFFLSGLPQSLRTKFYTQLSKDSAIQMIANMLNGHYYSREGEVKMDIKKGELGLFKSEIGPVEELEFTDLPENDPTVEMLTRADSFEAPEDLIADIAIKYDLTPEEAQDLFEDVKGYVGKYSSILSLRIVQAWTKFLG